MQLQLEVFRALAKKKLQTWDISLTKKVLKVIARSVASLAVARPFHRHLPAMVKAVHPPLLLWGVSDDWLTEMSIYGSSLTESSHTGKSLLVLGKAQAYCNYSLPKHSSLFYGNLWLINTDLPWLVVLKWSQAFESGTCNVSYFPTQSWWNAIVAEVNRM